MSAQLQFLVRSQCGVTCLASKTGHGGRGKPAPNLVHFHETCFQRASTTASNITGSCLPNAQTQDALVKRGRGGRPAASSVEPGEGEAGRRRIGRMSVAFANSASTASRLGSSNVPSCVGCRGRRGYLLHLATPCHALTHAQITSSGTLVVVAHWSSPYPNYRQTDGLQLRPVEASIDREGAALLCGHATKRWLSRAEWYLGFWKGTDGLTRRPAIVCPWLVSLPSSPVIGALEVCPDRENWRDCGIAKGETARSYRTERLPSGRRLSCW